LTGNHSQTAFAEYVARKEDEARRAAIAPFTTEIDDPPRDAIAIANEWSRAMFGGAFYASPAPSADLPATNLVFVQSPDGNTVARDPSTLGGGDADKHLIYEGLSRVAADAVMAGAETIRGGRIVFSTWRAELVQLRRSLGLPRHPIQIVATLRGLSFDGVLFNTPELRVVILTVGQCVDLMITPIEDRPWITTLTMPTAGDLPSAFRHLRAMGVDRISCVGGRTLARQLIDARLVQDLYLTTGTKAEGEPNTPLYAAPLNGRTVTRKHGTGTDAGVLFEHTRLNRPSSPV